MLGHARVLTDDHDRELQHSLAKHRAEIEAMSAYHKQQLDFKERKRRADILEIEKKTFELASIQLKKTVMDVGKQWSDRLMDEKQRLLQSLTEDYESKLLNLANLHNNELQAMRAQTEQLREECSIYEQKLDEMAAHLSAEQVQHELEQSSVIVKYYKLLQRAGIEKDTEMSRLNDKITELTIASEKDIDKAKFRVALNSTCRASE